MTMYHFLLLLLLHTTAAATVASLTTITLPPASSPHPHSSSTIQIGAEDFKGRANFLKSADLSILPVPATVFIPADDDSFPPSTTPTMDTFIFPYHIVPQRLSFLQLRKLQPFSRLPTLLPGKSILITNNSASNFTLDASLLSYPDLYTTSTLAFHGISNLLDYSVYGDASGKSFDSQMEEAPPRPPKPKGESVPGDGSLMDDLRMRRPPHHHCPPHHHRHPWDASPPDDDTACSSDAACLRTQVYNTVFLVVIAIWAWKVQRMSLGY